MNEEKMDNGEGLREVEDEEFRDNCRKEWGEIRTNEKERERKLGPFRETNSKESFDLDPET